MILDNEAIPPNRAPLGERLQAHLDSAMFLALLAMVFFIPLAESPKSIFFVLSLVCWVAQMALSRDFRIIVPTTGRFLLVWLGVVIISAVQSDCGITGIRDVLMYTLFFLLVVNTVRSHEKIWGLVGAVLVGMGLTSGISVAQAAYHYIQTGAIDRIKVLSLAFPAPYIVTVLSLIIGLALCFRWKKPGWVLFGAISLLSMTTLALTHNNRASMAALVLITIVIAGLKRTLWPLLLAGILLIGAVGLGFLVFPSYQSRIEGFANPSTDASLLERVEIWKASAAMVRDYPVLGIGPKCFRDNRKRYHIPNDQGEAHNQFLHVAAEVGFLGLTAFLFWLGSCARFVVTRAKRPTDNLAKALWYGALGGLVVILVQGLTAPIFSNEMALIFLLLMGLSIVVEEKNCFGDGEISSQTPMPFLLGPRE